MIIPRSNDKKKTSEPRGAALSRRRPALLLAAVLAAATLLAHAGAQAGESGAGPAVAEAVVYQLSQGGVALGDVGVAVSETAEGFRSESWVDLPGLLKFDDVLVTGPDGAAVSYQLAGVVQGIDVAMSVTFDTEGAHAELTQADQSGSFSVPSSEPLYVFDNNLVDGLQVLLHVASRSPEAPLDVAIIVPQAGALGRVQVGIRSGPAGVSEVEAVGRSVSARGADVVMQVGPQRLEFEAWIDEDGVLVALDQPVGAVRYARRYDLSRGAQGGTGGGPLPVNAAEELIAATSECVETRELSVVSTGTTLRGVLSLPRQASVAPTGSGAPTLVLLPGSGAVDLDGNAAPLIGNSGYHQLANALGCHGYGVLRIAKLGIAPSSGDANDVTLSTYAQNTRDWLDLLAATPGVDPARLGLIGHSEGGLIALYAATEGYVEPAALVLIATPGRPLDALLREQLLASLVRAGTDQEALAAYAGQIDELLAAVRASTGTALDLSGDLADNEFAPLFAPVAGLLRSEFEVDPAELASRVRAPTVVIQGLKDVQVLRVDGAALAAALPAALHLELADLTHNLVDTPLAAEAMLLPGRDAVISQTLVTALATYLHGSLKLAR